LAQSCINADGSVELDHVEAFVAIVRRDGFSRTAATCIPRNRRSAGL
jgi:hypothetical protein